MSLGTLLWDLKQKSKNMCHKTYKLQELSQLLTPGIYLKLCPLGVTCLLCRESLVTVTASISSSSGRARATRSGSVMISLYASSHSTDPARDSLESEEGVAAADTNCLQGDTGSSLIDGSWKLKLIKIMKIWRFKPSEGQLHQDQPEHQHHHSLLWVWRRFHHKQGPCWCIIWIIIWNISSSLLQWVAAVTLSKYYCTNCTVSHTYTRCTVQISVSTELWSEYDFQSLYFPIQIS